MSRHGSVLGPTLAGCRRSSNLEQLNTFAISFVFFVLDACVRSRWDSPLELRAYTRTFVFLEVCFGQGVACLVRNLVTNSHPLDRSMAPPVYRIRFFSATQAGRKIPRHGLIFACVLFQGPMSRPNRVSYSRLAEKHIQIASGSV